MIRLRDTDHLCELLAIPFSDQQLAAITAPADRPQAIIAGAGSGKTAVMAARVVWLVGHDDIDPESILGLTFTVKAAAELSVRVRDSLLRLEVEPDDGEPTVSTYHAFAGDLIAEHGLRLGLEPDLRVLADASRFQLAARAIRAYRGPLKTVSWWLPTTIADVLALDSQLSEHLTTTDELRSFDAEHQHTVAAVPKQVAAHRDMLEASCKRVELSHLVDAYRHLKHEAGVMDFSDQMAWGAELATVPEVADDLRARFAVVLLDEYQDTSVAQRDLLRSLFAGGGVSAVGDPAQGIYGWRGAASGNLIGFLDDFGHRDGSPGLLHSLDVSRRCAHGIIEVANEVAAPFYADPEVKRVVRQLRAAPENPVGVVSAALHETVSAEIDDVVRRVVEAGQRRDWSSIAVLVRASGENERLVAALRAAGVPVEIVGLTGLLGEPEVIDVVCMLELIDDLTANPALLRLLAGPRWSIGDRDLALLGARAAQLGRAVTPHSDDESLRAQLDIATRGIDPTEVVSLAEALEDPGTDLPYSPQALTRFAELAAILRQLRRHAHEPLLDLTRRVINELDLDVELRVDDIATDNLDLLVDAVATYARDDRYASLGGLLAYLTAERDYNEGMELSAPTEANSVKLLTIHKSKGLEFDEVFVLFVSGSVFPSGQGRSNWLTSAKTLPTDLRGDAPWLPRADDLSTNKAVTEYRKRWRADAEMEEVRLGYVAFTRARHRLHVSGHRWGRTQIKPRKVSDFLETVRRWLVAHGGAPDVWAPEPDDTASNPQISREVHAWPVPLPDAEPRRRLASEVEEQLEQAAGLPLAVHPTLQALRDELDLLLHEAEQSERRVVDVVVPSTVSVTDAMALAADEMGYARRLARPLPRRPSQAARQGTAFHAWIEAGYGQQSLIDPADLPGRGDEDIADDVDLAELKVAFERTDYAARVPVAVEAPFVITIGGQRITGRIDAVFSDEHTRCADGRQGWEVVDWKTGRTAVADPLQLTIYRLAWAERLGVEPERVKATYCHIRLGTTTSLADPPGRAAVAARLRLR